MRLIPLRRTLPCCQASQNSLKLTTDSPSLMQNCEIHFLKYTSPFIYRGEMHFRVQKMGKLQEVPLEVPQFFHGRRGTPASSSDFSLAMRKSHLTLMIFAIMRSANTKRDMTPWMIPQSQQNRSTNLNLFWGRFLPVSTSPQHASSVTWSTG